MLQHWLPSFRDRDAHRDDGHRSDEAQYHAPIVFIVTVNVNSLNIDGKR